MTIYNLNIIKNRGENEMKYSLVKNQKEFAIVEDYLLKGVNLEESTVTPLDDDEIWDDIIDHYNSKGMRYTVVDDQEELKEVFY